MFHCEIVMSKHHQRVCSVTLSANCSKKNFPCTTCVHMQNRHVIHSHVQLFILQPSQRQKNSFPLFCENKLNRLNRPVAILNEHYGKQTATMSKWSRTLFAKSFFDLHLYIRNYTTTGILFYLTTDICIHWNEKENEFQSWSTSYLISDKGRISTII